jgi:hypothetical protein
MSRLKSKFTFILFLVSFSIISQNKKETVYLLFDNHSKEKCKIEVEQTYENKEGIDVVKKYRKEKERKNHITFYICEEIFTLDKKSKIDTCDVKYLSKIKFETLQTLESKRGISKYAFKNSVFKKIYLVEKQKDKIIKYPVVWTTDSVQY